MSSVLDSLTGLAQELHRQALATVSEVSKIWGRLVDSLVKEAEIEDKLLVLIMMVLMDWGIRSECVLGYINCLSKRLGKITSETLARVDENTL